MKRYNVGAFLIGILFLLPFLFTLIATCASCAIPQQPAVRRPMDVRESFGVRVDVFCINDDPFQSGTLDVRGATGSGVVLGGRRILTALHVVRCQYLADIHVILNDGRRLRAFVEREWPGHDIARLTVYEEISMTSAPIARLPLPDHPVCSSFSYPSKGGSCGVVESVREKSLCQSDHGSIWCNDAAVTFDVTKGNSGGGVYDIDGNLVGIVTGSNGIGGISMGGFISSLAPIANEVLR